MYLRNMQQMCRMCDKLPKLLLLWNGEIKMLPYVELKISIYSLAVLLGMDLALICASARMKRYGYNGRILTVIFVCASLGMVIGSKLLFFATQLPHVIHHFSWGHLFYTFLTSGFVFYGGLLGALLGIRICSFLLLLDQKRLESFCAPCFALFHGCGRIGCFFAGCCYGVEWKYGIAMAEDPEVPRFPVQLVEAIFEFGVCIYLLRKEKKTPKDVPLMNIYLILYAVFRFFIEFLRGDRIRGIWLLGLSTSQIISLIILGVMLKKAMPNLKKKKYNQ